MRRLATLLAIATATAAALAGAASAGTTVRGLSLERLGADLDPGNQIAITSCSIGYYDGSFAFQASGPAGGTYFASGAYPGTFTESASVVVGPPAADGSYPVTSISGSFTIASDRGSVDGTLTLGPDAHYSTSDVWADACHYDYSLRRQVAALFVGGSGPSPLTYQATISTADGATCTDSGSATLQLDDTGTWVNPLFVEDFTAASRTAECSSGPADTTAPTSTASVSPTPNAAGWNDGPVTIDLSAADEDGGSGVASITYDTGSGPQSTAGDSVSVPVTAEGTTTVTYHATDTAGNAEEPHTLTVRIDETAPAISASDVTADATSAGGATVTYDAAASDNLDPSPTLSCDPASGSTFAVGSTTVTCTATDRAGNEATATFTVTVRGAADQIADELDSEDGLGAKQAAALADARAGRTNAACGVLGAYANQVRALAGKKLSADEAAQLLATVQRIETVLGC